LAGSRIEIQERAVCARWEPGIVKERPEVDHHFAALSSDIAALVEPLDETELESLTIAAIRQHRMYVARAEHAFERWKSASEIGANEITSLRRSYVQVMLDQSVQMAVLASLIDRLGYVPDV
jgi:hypothetical protein